MGTQPTERASNNETGRPSQIDGKQKASALANRSITSFRSPK
ncbi:hypothetical protein EVA_18343 [gut metagenome]|uniref:Uncharacterized protein n=1 Tax=gut metagenome TaxID=749906 RepID=J9C181_9ZZZZ